jgi:hypothetical protein
MYCQTKENKRSNTNANANTNTNANMSKLQTLRTYLQTLEDNKRIFTSPVMVQTKSGSKQWKATSESLELIFTNLKRSISNKSNINELEKLFLGLSQNKFESSFKTFIKAITNRLASSSDVNIGSCPKMDKYCPKNTHEHNKFYLLQKIISWYISYYEWKTAMNQKKKLEQEKKKPKEPEKVDENSSDGAVIIPDSWDNDDDESNQVDVPDSWEDNQDDIPDSWEDNQDDIPDSWED